MILLTGFQSYAGRSINPAEAVMRALDGKTLAGVPVRGVSLPVDFAAVRDGLPGLIDESAPRIILSLGLWPGEPMIRIERMASNWSLFELPDRRGHRQNGRVVEDGPDGYLTTLPADAMQTAIRASGLPCRQSGTAGTYLCNATAYLALHHCARQHAKTQAGFIHLPYLPQQVALLLDALAEEGSLEMHQRADFASMSLDAVIYAVTVALETALGSLNR